MLPHDGALDNTLPRDTAAGAGPDFAAHGDLAQHLPDGLGDFGIDLHEVGSSVTAPPVVPATAASIWSSSSVLEHLPRRSILEALQRRSDLEVIASSAAAARMLRCTGSEILPDPATRRRVYRACLLGLLAAAGLPRWQHPRLDSQWTQEHRSAAHAGAQEREPCMTNRPQPPTVFDALPTSRPVCDFRGPKA